MPVARLATLAIGATAPALALAEESATTRYGWLWALVTVVVVIGLFVLFFKGRPPVGRAGRARVKGRESPQRR